MKTVQKVFFSTVLIFLVFQLHAQSRYWIGSSGGLWSSAANWSATSGGTGGASSPSTLNDVIFDNAFTGIVEMDVLSSSTFTIHSLKVTANVVVTLQRTQAAGGTRIFQLASTSNSIKALQIDNGSTLTLDAINSSGTLNYELAFTGGAGVTGEIAGNLYFKGTGTGTGGAEIDLQDDATHYAALIVKNNGVIKYFTNSGTTSPATGSYLTMESGSTYEINKNGGSFPPANWDANSLAKVTGTTTNGPTFNGIQFGNLEWNCPGHTTTYFFNANLIFNNVNLVTTNGTAIRIKSGASAGVNTLTINGDLTIGATSKLELTGNTVTSGNGGRINLKGNLLNQGILTTGGITGTINDFEMNGTLNQTITNTGTFSGSLLSFIQNNTAGTTLLSPLTLPYNLTLTNGKIITTATNLLTMIDNATYAGGSSASFIEGPLKKIGDDNFIFPVGTGSIYAPVGLTHVSGTTAVTDAFTVTYKRTNPNSVYASNYAAGIDHISYVEYWDITKNSGSVALLKKVMLTATAQSFSQSLAHTFISHFNGTQWTNESSSSTITGTSGVFELGTITTIGGISTFSPFTLATDLPFAMNPLPVQLISFTATKVSSAQSFITWELAATCSRNAIFEVQRSTDKTNYSSIVKMPGSETSRYYSFNDVRTPKGINYYRLKMTDEDGKITYSKIVTVMNEEDGLLITSIAPNPAIAKTTLTIHAAKDGPVNFSIYNLTGKLIRHWQLFMNDGTTILPVNTNDLSTGMYCIIATSGDARTVVQLIKQ